MPPSTTNKNKGISEIWESLDELFPPILMGSLVLLALGVIALGGLAWSTRQELGEVRQDHALLYHKFEQILKGK
jgi:hypothetical protein